MFSKLLLFLLPFTLFTSNALCQDFEEQQEFKYFENSQITHDSILLRYRSYKLIAGDYIVFEFTSDNAGDPGNLSKIPSTISFQVKKGTKKFQLNDEEIGQHAGVYIQTGYSMDRGIMVIEKGMIKGKKMDDGSWEVQFDVTFSGLRTGINYHIAASGIYNLVEI